MPIEKIAVPQTKTNTCPHGLPHGACPVCSGMSGGGSSKTTKQKNPNEWSYEKCFAVWQEMLAKENKKSELKLQLIKQANLTEAAARKLANTINGVKNVLHEIKSMLPLKMQANFDKAINKIITPIYNMISKFPQFIKNIKVFVQDIKTQILDVTSKIAAVIGEVKNFIQKSLYEKYKKVSKKIFLFFFSEAERENDSEEMRVFESRELKKVKKTKLRQKSKGEIYEHSVD